MARLDHSLRAAARGEPRPDRCGVGRSCRFSERHVRHAHDGSRPLRRLAKERLLCTDGWPFVLAVLAMDSRPHPSPRSSRSTRPTRSAVGRRRRAGRSAIVNDDARARAGAIRPPAIAAHSIPSQSRNSSPPLDVRSWSLTWSRRVGVAGTARLEARDDERSGLNVRELRVPRPHDPPKRTSPTRLVEPRREARVQGASRVACSSAFG